MRINSCLARAGLGSRRACEDLIRQGLVLVNGESVTQLGMIIDTERDSVTVEGNPIELRAETLLLALNKPEGVLSTASDGFGRRTVIDIAREQGYRQRLFPVGRLDMNTSGILLLTNDGILANRLMHPRYKVEKRYFVLIEGQIEDRTVKRIAAGVDLGGRMTQPCVIDVLERDTGGSTLDVRIREGRKRQIRRMFSAHGHEVKRLRRVALGDLEFPDLEPGRIRPLTTDEEHRIRRMAGLL